MLILHISDDFGLIPNFGNSSDCSIIIDDMLKYPGTLEVQIDSQTDVTYNETSTLLQVICKRFKLWNDL